MEIAIPNSELRTQKSEHRTLKGASRLLCKKEWSRRLEDPFNENGKFPLRRSEFDVRCSAFSEKRVQQIGTL